MSMEGLPSEIGFVPLPQINEVGNDVNDPTVPENNVNVPTATYKEQAARRTKTSGGKQRQ